MRDQNKIEKLAGEALNSLDKLQQLEPNEFLAAKAWQLLQNQRAATPAIYNKLLYKLAVVLILFIGINCFSFYLTKSAGTTTTETTTGVNAFADAYGLNNYSENY